MTDWKIYRIIEKEVYDNFIHLDLDNVVEYENENTNSIYITKNFPLNFCEGNHIEIDNNLTRRRRSHHDSISTSEVRFTNVDDYAYNLKRVQKDYIKQNSNLQQELDKQERINRELVSMLNSFSQRMLGNENFVNSSCASELDLSEWRRTLNKIANKFETKDEEQLALVTKSSTELSVTKETLRLTYNDNLNLQKLISDNKENHQRELDSKDKQLDDKDKTIKQGLELYKKKEDEVKDLNKKNDELKDKNAELREEKTTAETKLQRKEEEIDELRDKLGQSEEEFLKSKIRLKQERLELFADRLEVSLEKIQNLRECFEEKFNTQSGNDRKEVERKITQTKQELRSKIKMEDVQEICSRCEEIAELQIKLEKLHSQQFEAKQEVPTNQ
jgi:chromosome segregation ATPase